MPLSTLKLAPQPSGKALRKHLQIFRKILGNILDQSKIVVALTAKGLLWILNGIVKKHKLTFKSMVLLLTRQQLW